MDSKVSLGRLQVVRIDKRIRCSIANKEQKIGKRNLRVLSSLNDSVHEFISVLNPLSFVLGLIIITKRTL